MKRLWIILLSLFFAACAAKPFGTEKTACEAPDFTAVVISDLHYTVSPSEFNSIVALEPLVQEVTDALIDQVIAMKPDAFILTGDLTNNGKEEDVKAFAEMSETLPQNCGKSGMPVLKSSSRPAITTLARQPTASMPGRLTSCLC